jgi:hypothetical protein
MLLLVAFRASLTAFITRPLGALFPVMAPLGPELLRVEMFLGEMLRHRVIEVLGS